MTPPRFLAGFQGDRRATHVHRDLWVRTVAVREGDGRPSVLAVSDLIGIVREDTVAIRRAVADLDADVVVAATHTHSGPDTIGLWGPDPSTRGGRRGVPRGGQGQGRGVDPRRRRDARARGDRRLCGRDRRRDPELPVTLEHPRSARWGCGDVRSDRGRPRSRRSSTWGSIRRCSTGSSYVSPDLAGAVCLAVEETRGGVAVWASGDLGGMQSPAEGPRTPAEVDRKAALVADVVTSILEGRREGDGRVDFRAAEVSLPLWNPRFRLHLESGLLRGDLRPNGTLVTEVAAVDLGLAILACWPGEVLPRTGHDIEARVRRPGSDPGGPGQRRARIHPPGGGLP